MRIAAMAAGAVGGYFGARMAAAGHDVFFIARGANRDAIKKNGLRIESVHGDLHLPKPNVTDDPAKRRPGRYRAVRGQAVGHREGRRTGASRWSAPTRASSPCRTASTASSASRRFSAPSRPSAASLISPPSSPRPASSSTPAISPRCVFGTRRQARRRARSMPSSTPARPPRSTSTLSADIERERWEKFIFLTAMAGADRGTCARRIGPIPPIPTRAPSSATLWTRRSPSAAPRASRSIPAYVDERMDFARQARSSPA